MRKSNAMPAHVVHLIFDMKRVKYFYVGKHLVTKFSRRIWALGLIVDIGASIVSPGRPNLSYYPCV